MIVRWGLDELPGLVANLGLDAPLLLASERWSLPIEAGERWTEVPSTRVDEAAALAGGGVIAVGGGSAIDWTAGVADKTTSDCGATVLANYQQTPITRNPNLEEPIGRMRANLARYFAATP